MTGFLATAIALVSGGVVIAAAVFGRRWAMAAYLAGSVFLADASFRTRAVTETGLDWQVGLKLALWAGAGLIGAAWLAKTYRTLLRPPALLLCIFVAYGAASLMLAPRLMYPLASLTTTLGAFLFVTAVLARLHWREVLNVTLAVLCLYLVVSITLYFIAPEIAQHRNLVRLGGIEFHRMRGLSHPNRVGWMAAAATGIALFMRADAPRCYRTWYGVAVVLGLMALLMAFSRTAIASFVAALGVMFGRRHPVLAWSIGIALAVVVTMALANHWVPSWSELMPLLVRGDRGGSDVREVSTLAGRTLLWATVIQMIGRSPLLGHGFAANRDLLVDEFRGQFFVPDQAHNEYLNVWLNMGVIGLILLAGIIALQLVGPRLPVALKFVVTLLAIAGLAEAYLFTGLPTTAMLIWMIAVVVATIERRGLAAGRGMQ